VLIAAAWCVLAISYLGDHVATHVEAQAQVVGWLGNRFAGRAAASNC
jgi:hypothetical protein